MAGVSKLFFLKDQTVSIFGLVSHTVSVGTIQLDNSAIIAW